MTPIFLLRLAALTNLVVAATAAPPPRARVPEQGPSLSSSKAFHLVLNVTVPGSDFAGDASVDKRYLGTEHTGAGQGALIPGATSSGVLGAVNLTYTVNDTIQDGPSSGYWEAFYTGSAPDAGNDDVYGVELLVGSETQFGLTTTTTDVGDDDDDDDTSCLAVTAPVAGTFAICDQGVEAPEAPQYSLFFVQGDSSSSSSSSSSDNLPDNCVAVKLLPECSSNDEYDDSDDFQAVSCYEDVASIDWSQQAVCS